MMNIDAEILSKMLAVYMLSHGVCLLSAMLPQQACFPHLLTLGPKLA